MIVRHNGATDPVFKRFLFYANFVVRLRVNSNEAFASLFAFVSSLLPDGARLFPRLVELSWADPQPCISLSSRSLKMFLHFSHVSTLTLRLQDQPSITTTTQGREFYAHAVVDLLSDVSHIVTDLQELTVHAPSVVSIPASSVLCFSSLRRANLHVCISGTIYFRAPDHCTYAV